MREKEVMTPEKFKHYGINIIQWTIIVAIINGILCFLGKCSPIEALVMMETRIILWPLYASTLFLILNYLVTGVFQFTKIPEILGGNWKKEEIVVCRYCSYEAFLLPVAFAVGSVVLITVLKLGIIKPEEEGLGAYFVYGFLLVVMIGTAVIVPIFLKNRVFIFYPEGVVSRNALGKTICVTYDKILYVTSVEMIGDERGRTYIRLHTKEKDLYVSRLASNFELAKEYAFKKCVDIKTYQQQKSIG